MYRNVWSEMSGVFQPFPPVPVKITHLNKVSETNSVMPNDRQSFLVIGGIHDVGKSTQRTDKNTDNSEFTSKAPSSL